MPSEAEAAAAALDDLARARSRVAAAARAYFGDGAKDIEIARRAYYAALDEEARALEALG